MRQCCWLSKSHGCILWKVFQRQLKTPLLRPMVFRLCSQVLLHRNEEKETYNARLTVPCHLCREYIKLKFCFAFFQMSPSFLSWKCADLPVLLHLFFFVPQKGAVKGSMAIFQFRQRSRRECLSCF